eukprot:TRINITY_DN113373_c0_g1_i1.p1 TRINITY_DN113373_c0_g1~~TRINITY_DN113373_c0_g1_i1.p1  ORF type:complete len:406 (+),score=60.28 TRINITY_DN113373_c0_g1_i1:76-1293(+)
MILRSKVKAPKSRPPPKRKVKKLYCSLRYKCLCAEATVECETCKGFTPGGDGLYCKLCFEHRHPWHRQPHEFKEILKKVEEKKKTLVEQLLENARKTIDETIEARPNKASAVAIREGISRLDDLLIRVQKNKEEVSQGIPHTQAETLQRFFRMLLAKKEARRRIRWMFRKIYDSVTESYYYVNTLTQATSFELPHVIDYLEDYIYRIPNKLAAQMSYREAAFTIQRAFKRWSKARKEKYSGPVAQRMATVIQAIWRGFAWRKYQLYDTIKSNFLRTQDLTYDTDFYYNIKTEESSWDKPILLEKYKWELPLTTDFAEDNDSDLVAINLKEIDRIQVTKIQSWWRGVYFRRRKLFRIIQRVWICTIEETYKCRYYFNRNTRESQWTKPVLLIKNGWDLPLTDFSSG